MIMKKIYNKPTMQLIEVKMQQMIAVSTLGKSDTTEITGAGDILSRETDFDDFDF